MSTLLIYTEQTSPRLVYIFNLLLKNLLGLHYEITSVKEQFRDYTGPKFSYSRAPLNDELHFATIPLLFETEIKYPSVSFVDWDDLVGFFPVFSESAIPFDIFATAFFIVSRYEEYLPHQKDKYDRYRASQSLNMKAGVLEKPIVNYYAKAIQKLLAARYPELIFKTIPFRYNVTFDIDVAYSHRGKGIKRTIGGLARSLLLSQFAEAKERIKTLLHKNSDPYDTYNYLLEVCNQHKLIPLFFFLVGDESRFDKNLSHNSSALQELIKRLDKNYEIGIHLSYRSHVASHIAKRELNRLEKITGHLITKNRYHYLRFQLPDTYERLFKIGITDDYSMGYAPHVGFRAGLCTPFKFFNLKRNEESLLTVHPISFMDTTFTHYYNTDTQFALEKIRHLMSNVKTCGGDFTGLWHNNSFTEKNEWKGWREIFEIIAREAALIMHNP